MVGDHLEPVDTKRVPIRLGASVFSQGKLDASTRDQTVAAFREFTRLFAYHNVATYRAVATSAVRSARNGHDLIHRIQRATGIDLDIIDGAEEAQLLRSAMNDALDDEPEFILDLGGGSLEIGYIDEDENWQAVSLPIGTVRALEMFQISESMDKTEAKMVRRYVRGLLKGLPVAETKVCAASGGNAEALARILGDGSHFLVSDLDDQLIELVSMTVNERMDTYDLRKDRAEVIAIAAVIFSAVGKYLRIERFVVPGVGIRDGILAELAQKVRSKTTVAVSERSTVAAARVFAQRVGHELDHTRRVAKFSLQLFDTLQHIHKLDEECRNHLHLAALLHDVGEVVHSQKHDKHGEYLVLNGRIPGLLSPAREMVAATVRGHKGSWPSDNHPAFSSLHGKQKKQVLKITALLRIADSLDVDHQGRIKRLSVETQTSQVVLQVAATGPAVAGERIKRKTDLFEDVFSLPIVVEEIPLKKPAKS